MSTLTMVNAEHSGKSEKDRLVEGEQILSRYSNGARVSDLIEEFGLSQATVYRRLQTAIDARIAPTVDEYRSTQNQVLDEQLERTQRHLAAALALIEQGEAQGDAKILDQGLTHHLRSMEMLNRILERRARLNGLDMPAKVDMTVTVQDETERAMAQLNEQLGSLVDAPA